MRTLLLATAAMAALTSFDADAKRIAAGGNCKLVENVTVGVNFNANAASIAEAKSQFDQQAAKIADVAGELKLGALEPQSMNYNIYPQNNSYGKSYNMNGSYQYKMNSSEVAFKFASMLEKHNMSANINSNSYRQGNCK